MAYRTQVTNTYVKFVKGTPTAFNSLVEKDSNTLYFISESNSTSGTLWLGNQQIGDGSTSSLAELIEGEVQDKNLLIYNAELDEWEPGTISEIIHTMTGATASTDGAAGLVPAPEAGDEDKFLRGDGTWAAVTAGIDFDTDDSLELNNKVLGISGFENAAVGSIPQKTSEGISWTSVASVSGGLSYQKVQSLADVTQASTIYLVPNDSGTDNAFDEYMYIDGQAELIGSVGDVNLSNYVTTSDFNTAIQQKANQSDLTSLSATVGNLSNSLDDFVTNTVFAAQVGNFADLDHVAGENSTIIEEINDINERLAWQIFVEE